MVKSLAEEIEVIVKNISNNNHAPRKCTVTGTYPDGKYVDVEIHGMGETIHKPLYGVAELGDECLIIFLDGDLNNGAVISGKYETGDLTNIYNSLADLSANKSDINHTHEDLEKIAQNMTDFRTDVDLGDGYFLKLMRYSNIVFFSMYAFNLPLTSRKVSIPISDDFKPISDDLEFYAHGGVQNGEGINVYVTFKQENNANYINLVFSLTSYENIETFSGVVNFQYPGIQL